MLAYLSAEGLGQYLHGANAPIWRALATPGNSLWLNAVAAVVTALALGYAFGRFVQFARQEPQPSVGWRVAMAFFCVPPFVLHITGLSPLMVMLLPVSLSLAALMLPGGAYRMLLSGAFAALAAWEGTIGVAFVPIVLLAIWMSGVHREEPIFRATSFWTLGFIAVLVAEGLCLGFNVRIVKPIWPPLAGLGFFVCIGIVPAIIVIGIGWNRWVSGIWAGALAVSLSVTLVNGSFRAEGGGERFARTVLKDLGARKLIITDGLSDDFFTLLKPADVRLVGTRSDADREFLLNFFESGEPVTNKALVVSRYRDTPEWDEMIRELGFGSRVIENKAEARRMKDLREREAEKERAANAVPVEIAMSNMASRVVQNARPLMELVAAAEAEFAKPLQARDRATLEKAREAIRREWRAHTFGGSRLSNVLIMSDIMLGDTRAAASDAITVLMSDREDPSANAALGAIRQEEGKFDLAERYLRKGVKGGGVLALGKLAILLLQTGRPEEAVEWARKALEKCPGDTSLREPLAAALIESGRFDEAEAELKEIARLAKENGSLERENAFLAGARKRLAEKRKR